MDEDTKVKVFVLAVIGLIIGSFYYVQNEKEKEKVKAGDCFRIKNSISISKMEETLEASQANKLFNIRYKDLIEKKYGVRYCFQADNVGECERYKREESIRNDRDIKNHLRRDKHN
jgi:hypothetical protein